MADIKKVIVIDVETKAGEDLTKVGQGITNVGQAAAGSMAELRQLKKELRNTAAGTDEFNKLSAKIRDLEDSITDARKSNDDFLGQLESAPGPLGALGKAIRGTETIFSSFSGALKASGIGLIVAALGGLVGAFRDNEVAMKKIQPLLDGLQKIFGGIFRAVEPLFNSLVDMAMTALPYVTKGVGVFYSALVGLFTLVKEAGGGYIKILKGIATLDFSQAKEGLAQIQDSFSKAVKSGTEAYKRFEVGSKELTKSEKEEAEKRQKAADEAAAKKKAAQEKASQDAIKEKEKEAARLKAIEDKRLADDMKSAQDAVNILNKLRDANETPAEKLQREYEAEKLVLEANNISTEELTRQHLAKLQKLKDDANTKKVTKEDSEWLKLQQLTLEKDDYDKLVLTQKYEAEYLAAEGNAELQRQLKIKLNKDLADIDDKNKQKEIDNAKAVADAKIQLAQDGLSLISGVTELFAGKSEKQARKAFEIQKAVSLAQAIISGIEGTQNAYTTAQKSPITALFPGYPVVQAGLAGAFSAIKIAQISKQQFKGSGGAEAGGGAGGGAVAPQAQFNIVGQSSTNQLAGAIAGQQQQPIQAFVVASDVSTQQALDRNRINNSTFI